jgi:hypothetical protein
MGNPLKSEGRRRGSAFRCVLIPRLLVRARLLLRNREYGGGGERFGCLFLQLGQW